MADASRTRLKVVVNGEEVPGIIVYGLGSPESLPGKRLSTFEWAAQRTTSVFQLVGNHWRILMWELHLDPWPRGAEWNAALETTLESMLLQGAKVAWVGSEGLPFADPPHLFHPEHTEGAVLLWRSVDNGGGDLDPDEPLSSLSGPEMATLRALATGLADAD